MKNVVYLLPLFLLISCATRPTPSPTPAIPAPPEPPLPSPVAATTVEGKWRETRNQQMPVLKEKSWVFHGETITIDDGEEIYTGRFSCNDSADPKEIDFHFDGYPVNRGLYDVKGDLLTLKLLETADERASSLDDEEGYTLINCVRERGNDKELKGR